MSIHRNLAGLPVVVESPSRFRIDTQISWVRSCIVFTGEPDHGWTIEWREGARTERSNLRFKSAYDVALYLVRIGTGEALG